MPDSIPEPASSAEQADQVPLVSIVTPCFNGEHHVGRLIESVLAQTHPNIEFILVNDGSTDGTDEVVESYREQLEVQLTRFVYAQQENAGLGGAINGGLAHVSGEFLCWPDADDYLEPDSIELRLRVLQERPECAVVTSDARYVREHDGEVTGLASGGVTHNDDPRQFEHLLAANSIFSSGSHMVRSDLFRKTHQGFQIYPARRGQNWQMLLPLYFSYDRHFLPKPLYNIMVSDSSMSRGDTTVEKQIERVAEHREIKLRSLDPIDMTATERAYWDREIERIYRQSLVGIYLDSGDFEKARSAYRDLKAIGSIPNRSRLRLIIKLLLLRIRGNG